MQTSEPAEPSDVTLPQDAAIPSGLIIRPETSSDYVRIHRLVADAFGRQVEAGLVEKIRSSECYIPALALVAEHNGTVVGHVMVSNALLRSNTGDQVVAMLSPLAVLPESQRLGIGAALVHEVCERTGDQDYTFVVLEGSPAYYGRLGFEPASNYGITLPMPEWAPQEAAQLRRLAGFDTDIGRTIDATAGSTRDSVLAGRVVYPEPFHGLV